MSEQAQTERQRMLARLRRVVDLCTCEWPLRKYRNGDGHHPDCPAHQPLSARTREAGR